MPDLYAANTVLHLNYNLDASVWGYQPLDCSQAKNIIRPVGFTRCTSDQYKFGDQSGYYYAGYQYIDHTSNFDLTGVDWTIEAWVNPTGNYGNWNIIAAKRNWSGGITEWEVGLSQTTGAMLYYNGTLYRPSTTGATATATTIAANVQGSGGLDTLHTGSVDDSFKAVPLPFNVVFFGVTYNTVYVGSNSYLTFGAGSNVFSGVAANVPALAKIMIGARDNSYQQIFGGVSGTAPNRTYRIRFEGTAATSGTVGSPNIVWEVTFFENNPAQIELHLGSNSNTGGYFGVCTASERVADLPTKTNTGYTITTAAGVASPIPPANVWSHLAYVRSGTSLLFFLNGVNVYSTTLATAVNAGTNIVSIGTWGTEYYLGYIDDLRITKGVARYTSDFSTALPDAIEYTAPTVTETLYSNLKPTSGTTDAELYIDAPNVYNYGRTTSGTRDPELYIELPNYSDDYMRPLKSYYTYGGDGKIYGTVKQKSTPANLPLSRRVVLFDQSTGTQLAETWSDSVTGEYSFEYLDTGKEFYVVVFDHTNTYRAIAADAIYPTEIT